MDIKMSHSADHIIMTCTNEFYTLTWYHSYIDRKLVKYKIDSEFYNESGYLEIEYDNHRKPTRCVAYVFDILEDNLSPIYDINVKYEGDTIIYYSDQDGNWYDREFMEGVFPYEDPMFLEKQVLQAFRQIKDEGTTDLHYIVEPDYSRYE